MIWLCGDTHVGQKRAANQDVFFAEPFFEGALLMVCDGMGGEQGGETASRLAMEAACAMIKRDINVKKLAALDIYGAIIGKAYYTGAISLAEAIEVAK